MPLGREQFRRHSLFICGERSRQDSLSSVAKSAIHNAASASILIVSFVEAEREREGGNKRNENISSVSNGAKLLVTAVEIDVKDDGSTREHVPWPFDSGEMVGIHEFQ
jgi:hypothetical protein